MLKSMRSDEAFKLFFARVEVDRESTGTSEATLPRKIKAPSRFEIGTGTGHQDEAVEDLYRRHYFEALDLAIAGTEDRFNQPGYAMYRNLEEVIVYAANQKEYGQQLQDLLALYKEDLQPNLLRAQLQNFASHFASDSEPV